MTRTDALIIAAVVVLMLAAIIIGAGMIGELD